MTAAEHNKTLGILFLVYAGLQLFSMVAVGVMMVGMMAMIFAQSQPGDGAFIGFFTGFIVVALVITGLLFIPVLLAGLKIRKGKPDARGWGIAASAIAVLNFPLGTILGIYGLWFLLGDEGKQYYLGGVEDSPVSYPQPPPNSWQ